MMFPADLLFPPRRSLPLPPDLLFPPRRSFSSSIPKPVLPHNYLLERLPALSNKRESDENQDPDIARNYVNGRGTGPKELRSESSKLDKAIMHVDRMARIAS